MKKCFAKVPLTFRERFAIIIDIMARSIEGGPETGPESPEVTRANRLDVGYVDDSQEQEAKPVDDPADLALCVNSLFAAFGKKR